MRMLQRSFKVTTRFGGGFVQSIDGLAGTASRRDWFYYVNGIEAKVGAASTAVHRGDRIWWDLHDWTATDDVPAVVGSFPEPFVHGFKGRRLPTTLECAPDVPDACKQVAAELKAAGVPAATQLLGTGSGTDSLAVLVGTWGDLHGTFAGILIAHGPVCQRGLCAVQRRRSSLELLDPHGQPVRTLGAGAGLVAATAQGSSSPTWLVTGADAAGVSAAADALTPKRACKPLRAGGAGPDGPAGAAAGSAVSYRRRASPLHAARAGAGCAYCVALACAALLLSSPIALGAVVVAIVGAGIAAGLGREMRRAAPLAVTLAIVIALVNALVTRDGLTVIVRLGDLPVLGHTDVTLEATVYGADPGPARDRADHVRRAVHRGRRSR